MSEQDNIANRIKQLRNTLKLTQKQLAQELDVSITSICEIEKGKYKPNCDFIANLSKVYNVNLYWLLFGVGEIFLDATSMVMNQTHNFAAKVQDVHNFLWYFQRSTIIQHSTLAHFYSLMIKEKNSIEKEIQDFQKKN